MNTPLHPPHQRRGALLVVSAPSGAGKTSLCKELLKHDDAICLSISATTRPPRPGERDGEDYHFMTEHDFLSAVKGGVFLEHAKVFGHYYGTPRASVEDALAVGKDVLFDIDWQGAQQLAQAMPRDVVQIFILPPSNAALRERLTLRQQDSPTVIDQRMAKAAHEVSHHKEATYIIINDRFDQALLELKAIVQAERLKQQRYKELDAFVKSLT